VQSPLSALRAGVQLYTLSVERGTIAQERSTSFLKLETEQKLAHTQSMDSDSYSSGNFTLFTQVFF